MNDAFEKYGFTTIKELNITKENIEKYRNMINELFDRNEALYCK